jgi:ubiquinol-cytochrome c reductase cytochrome c subunit
MRTRRAARRARRLLLALAAPVALAACDYLSGDVGPYRAALEQDAASGKDLYLRDCAWCHGNRGEGTARGPDLISGTNGAAFTDFMVSTGRMPIDVPTQRAERGPPDYPKPQIDALVSYVASLGGTGPDIPELELDEGSLAEGLELYQENCAACHSTTLIGGAFDAGSPPGSTSIIAPELTDATPVEIAEAMLVGPDGMPVFGPETFSDEQVNSIVRYVSLQQEPNDRGGAPIGHIGPVAEGAFGWIVGMGAMVLMIRLLGTKTGEL